VDELGMTSPRVNLEPLRTPRHGIEARSGGRSFDKLAVGEGGSGADEGDQMGAVVRFRPE
jgi:hypothetical protein